MGSFYAELSRGSEKRAERLPLGKRREFAVNFAANADILRYQMAVALKQKTEVGPDLSTWLTRVQVTDLIGVSVQTLKAWEARGLLHPRMRPGTREERGRMVYVYDPHEVAAIPETMRKRAATRDNPDELAAVAFDMFERGCRLSDIVRKLRKRPEEIERLHEQWLTLGGADTVINEAAHAELARFVGPFTSVPELVERVKDALGVMTIEATVPDDASDEQIERAILRFLDHHSALPCGSAAHVGEADVCGSSHSINEEDA